MWISQFILVSPVFCDLQWGFLIYLFFYRDIQDLQRRNQELLEVVRELGERKEEEESLATEEK